MRILFVDDQPQVLDSLRDALRPQRHVWTMAFAPGGPEALVELGREAYDVVVSDMRMAPMDGAELLGQVEESHPDAVRIVLSGSAEREVVVRAAAVAHRFLAKPCDTDELIRVIDRSCALRALTSQGELQRVTTTATRLPAAPRLHNELTALLRDGEASPADAATIIEQDVAMSAKVLQLVNSAFFGLRRRVTDVREAAVMLGLSTLRALVLSAHAFDRLAPAEPIAGFDLDALQRHCSQVARVARELLPNGAEREDAFAAALLHDVGLLVMATQERDRLVELLARAEREQRPLVDVELEERGVTHAEIGAHMLALWGLPDAIVEAVACHHRPLALPQPKLDAVAAVAVANALVHECQPGDRSVPRAPLDLDHIEALGLADRLDDWRAIAAQVVAAG